MADATPAVAIFRHLTDAKAGPGSLPGPVMTPTSWIGQAVVARRLARTCHACRPARSPKSLRVLVESIGPVVLLVHSASGPMGWWIAETAPAAVAAVIGVAPGAPANILPVLPDDPAEVAKLRHDASLGCPILAPEDKPVCVDEEFIRTFWANAPRFPKEALAPYCRSIVPESARLFNERFNIGGRGLRIGDPGSLASIADPHRHRRSRSAPLRAQWTRRPPGMSVPNSSGFPIAASRATVTCR